MKHAVRQLLLAALFTATCTALSATAADAAGGARFGAQPADSDTSSSDASSYFVFEAKPGTTIQSNLRIVNTGNEAGSVRLYAVDSTTGQTSGTVFLLGDDPRRNVGTWIHADQSELTLGAGRMQTVPFTVTVPADAVAGQHVGGIVVEDTDLKGADAPVNGARIQLRNRLALAVQVNVPGPAIERLVATRINPGGDDGYQTLLVQLTNSGSTLLRPSGTLAVTDASGRRLQHIPLKLDTLLPLTTIDYPIFMEGTALGEGSYVADLVLQYGGGHQLDYSSRFVISPREVAQVFAGRERLAPPPGLVTTAVPMPGPSTLWQEIARVLLSRQAGAIYASLGTVLLGIGLGMRWMREKPSLPSEGPFAMRCAATDRLDWRLD